VQPGRQEWLTVIECVSATGEKIPPYIIFKGKNLMTSWFPEHRPKGWMFACNTKGWTNNYHGMQWIKHFESATQSKLQSPEEYRLLICDGHDSHISSDFIAFCIQKRIHIILLPPHSSHLLQPLDVGIFSPLKRALSKQISRLVRTGIARIQKVEWIECFIEARARSITKDNILSGWRGAGLFPENMHRILIQLAGGDRPSTPNTPPPMTATITPFLPNSAAPNPASFHSINQAFLNELAKTDITTPFKTHVRRLGHIRERYQAESLILKEELKDVKEVNGRRKAREKGKRMILKDTPVISTEGVEKLLREAEEATKAKAKRKGKRRAKRGKKKAESSEESSETSTDDDIEDLDALRPELFDCIEVARNW
jgi:hypothetical protein